MLNPAQQQAANTLEGPLQIIAGPGTGKTHTLIARIHNLIKTTPAHKILALTFTNKAAHEIRHRLEPHKINTHTFHSLAARLLRKHWNENFTINDDKDPNTLTFDDLLTKLLEIFANQETLQKCQALFNHILVDEYQDVTDTQIQIIQKLAQPHKNICVVGDADQTIYSWRGAKATTMQNFAQLYPNTKTIKLNINYRNPPQILKAAGNLIQKQLTAHKTTTNQPQLWTANSYSEKDEILTHLLQQTLGSHNHMTDADHLDSGQDCTLHTFEDIAIIYRTQHEGKRIARLLHKHGYNYQLSSPENFWQTPEITKFLDHLTPLLHLPHFPDQPFKDWLHQKIDTFIENTDLKPKQIQNLHHLCNYSNSTNPILQALQEFLDEAHLQQEADNLIKPNAIRLLTFHASKGLEFPITIITGLEDETLPHKKHHHDQYWLAEERRLFYVGITRAKQQLHLIHTKPAGQRSRFLKELTPLQLATLPQARLQKLKKRKAKKAQMKMF